MKKHQICLFEGKRFSVEYLTITEDFQQICQNQCLRPISSQSQHFLEIGFPKKASEMKKCLSRKAPAKHIDP